MTKKLTIVRTAENTYAGVYLNGQCILQGYLTDDDRSEDDTDIEAFIKGASLLADDVTNITSDEPIPYPATWSKLFTKCQYGTTFEYEGCSIHVDINSKGVITDIAVPGVWKDWCPVIMLDDFFIQLKREEAGRRSDIWTDHHEEPSTNVYLATGPNWEGARFITETEDLVATVNDCTKYSLVRLSLELSLC